MSRSNFYRKGHMTIWIGIGAAVGVGLGVVFSPVWGDDTGVSIAISIAIGTAISVGFTTVVAIALDSKKQYPPAEIASRRHDSSRVPQSKKPQLS